jgi:hypothetical protein
MTTQSIKIAGASFSKHVSKLKLPYIDLAVRLLPVRD